MGRNLSPVLCRELENLDKDADSRKNAMKALRSYVKDLDSKAIPLFLAQVSATKEPGSSSGEYTISLYEVLARVHGRNIVPQIENIMSTILKTLSSSAGSFPLHQACSKVVPAIARYGIEPTMHQDEKTMIIASLCKPLADVLMGSPESLASGAALCLKALVESDNWRFASNDMVNELCLKVAGALEENSTQTNAHMGLAMALSKHNIMIAEAYARSLLRSGLQILAAGTAEGNSQKRFFSIQMINFLMKCVDSRSIFSELTKVAEVMEKCQGDPMPYIKGAAYEALQTSKLISSRAGLRYELNSSPYVGSNCVEGFEDSPPGLVSLSPESQTLDSFVGQDSLAESPLSTGQSSCNVRPGRGASRRLWNNEGGLDVSLKDGLFSSGSAPGSSGLRSYIDQFESDPFVDRSGIFCGFVEPKAANSVKGDSTPSPRRPRSPISIRDQNIFSTPRRLLRSLQDETDENSGCRNECSNAVPRSPTPLHFDINPITEDEGLHNYSHNLKHNTGRNAEKLVGDRDRYEETAVDQSESVSSSGDQFTECTACKSSCKNCKVTENGAQTSLGKKRWCTRATVSLLLTMCLALPAIAVSVMWMDEGQIFLDMVPT